MLAAVLLYGIYPTGVAILNDGGVEPASFLLFVHFLGTAFAFVAALVTRTSMADVISAWRILMVNSSLRWLLLISMLFNTAANILIFISLGGNQKIQSAVIYETWPLFFIVLTIFFRRERSGGMLKVHNTPISLTLLVIGVLGLLLVSTSGREFSQLMQFSSWLGMSSSLYTASAAALFMAASAFSGTTLNRRLASLKIGSENETSDRGKISVITTAILFRSVSTLIAITYVIFLDENVLSNIFVVTNHMPQMLFCGLVVGLGGILFHYANVTSNHSNINFLWYFVPAFSAFSLVVFGLEENIHSQIIVGTILIIISNLGLNLRVDYSFSYIMSLIALSFSSIICLKFPAFPVNNYYEALGVISALFAILVAFYTDRQFERFKERKNLFLEIFNSAEHLDDSELKSFSLSHSNLSNLTQFQMLFVRYKNNPTLSERILKYYHEMQQSVPFADIFIIWLLGISTIMIAILTRDPNEYLSQFVPVILSVAVVFLCASTTQDIRQRYDGGFYLPNSEDLSEIFGAKRQQELTLTSVFISICVLVILLALQFTAALLSLQ